MQQWTWRIPLALGMIAALLLLTACGTKVTRIGDDEQHDLSGRWNDTDSRLVSEAMIEQAMAHPWATDYRRERGSTPVVIVGDVRNRTHEHINVATFVRDIERVLINTSGVDVVASRDERGELRDERLDQDLHASEETRKAMGQELGADFMLMGTLNSILDQEGRREVVYYQVDLTLVSLADNRKVWAGQKTIRKLVERPRARM